MGQPVCRIQEIMNHFQIDDLSRLRQIRSRGLCFARGEEDINIRLLKVFEAWIARRQNNGTRSLLLHHSNTTPPPLWTTWKQTAFRW